MPSLCANILHLMQECTVTTSPMLFDLTQVKVNGMEYQPTVPANNKKQAKMHAAVACLQELGLLPRT